MYNYNNIKGKRRVAAERVFDSLHGVDGWLFQEAFEVDDAEKLAALKREDKKKKRCLCAEYRLLHKAVACLVCLATVCGIFLFGYIRENRKPSVQYWDGFETIVGEVKIDSIDSLNYYSARRVLTTGRELGGLGGDTVYLSYDEGGGENEKKHPDSSLNDSESVVYYEFDPTWDYTVTKVIYFRAELKEENGFIADKLGGIGEIDVIITENSISDMITFGRGGRYYSCHVNSYISEGKSERITFTTHTYIDGFCIVKNMEQDNYSFEAVIENGSVIELDCDYEESTDGEWELEADRIRVVNGSSITVKTNVTFNITELENFFNSIVSQDVTLGILSKRRRCGTAVKGRGTK